MQPLDAIYLLVRIALAALSLVAAAVTLRYTATARALGRRWRTAGIGGVLLTFAAVLSCHDAIDNVVLRPHDPITVASWLWLFGFDILLPVWALLLIHAWRQRSCAGRPGTIDRHRPADRGTEPARIFRAGESSNRPGAPGSRAGRSDHVRYRSVQDHQRQSRARCGRHGS